MIKEKSCGIVVFDDNNKVLLIKHNGGHISFPKGHVEEGESDKETAFREVKEETGIEAKILSDKTYMNTYSPKEGYIKDVYYFVGKKIGGELNPQLEEVSICDFFDYENALKTLTYDIDRNILKEAIKDKYVILTGQTGSGKSSLLNRIDPSLNLKTDEISKALGRGKHTTRAIEFYQIDNLMIADTPGFSSLDFKNMTKEDIRDNFIEFEKYRNYCKYSDCMHIKEDDCYIKQMVKDNEINEQRYNDYLEFIKEKENEGISFNSKK